MNRIKMTITGLFFIACETAIASGDSHSVEAISSALNMTIPSEVIAEAQKADDGIMKKGDLEGQKVYLVTDARFTKIKTITQKILSNLEKDQQGWVLRVLDTNPKQINAFVTGGKYIYVFTGLIEAAQSDDELAFVLSHEIGHSFLKQNLRKESDSSQNLQTILVLGALLSKKHSERLINTAKIMDASYSQKDEEEADAIGVILTRKAGYDPMRGIDFFSRSKREGDEAKQNLSDEIEKDRATLEVHQKECAKAIANYNSSVIAQITQSANSINAYCAQVETMRISFNGKVEAYNKISKEEAKSSFYSSHPIDQSRIAAIAAAVDYMDGARTVETLSEYEQTQRVYQALISTKSSLISSSTQK